MRVGNAPVLANPGLRFLLDDCPAAPKDSAGHPSTVLEIFIGRVDDGIARLGSDVAAYNLKGLTCGESAFALYRVHGG